MKNMSRDSSREQLNTYYSEVLKCENSLSMLDEISRVVKQQERLD